MNINVTETTDSVGTYIHAIKFACDAYFKLIFTYMYVYTFSSLIHI